MRQTLTTNSVSFLAIGFAQPMFAHENEVHDRLDLLTSYFAEDAIVGEPSIVDCTLSDGTETTCDATNPTKARGLGARDHD